MDCHGEARGWGCGVVRTLAVARDGNRLNRPGRRTHPLPSSATAPAPPAVPCSSPKRQSCADRAEEGHRLCRAEEAAERGAVQKTPPAVSPALGKGWAEAALSPSTLRCLL